MWEIMWKKSTPLRYMFMVISVVAVVWGVSAPNERVMNLAWTLPGLLVGLFSQLWGVIAKRRPG